MDSVNSAEKYEDTKALFDYGFDEFRQVTIDRNTIAKRSIPINRGETEMCIRDRPQTGQTVPP